MATPEGRISRYLFGVEYSPKDLRLALVDSAGGRIGNAVDQVLLYCYPTTPRPGATARRSSTLVRLGGRRHRPRARRLHPDHDHAARPTASGRDRDATTHMTCIPAAARAGRHLRRARWTRSSCSSSRSPASSRSCIWVALLVLRDPLPAALADEDRPREIEGSLALELTWTIIPLALDGRDVRLGREGLLPHEPAARRRHDGRRRRQALDVEDPAADRPARDQRAARPRGQRGEARSSPPRT